MGLSLSVALALAFGGYFQKYGSIEAAETRFRAKPKPTTGLAARTDDGIPRGCGGHD